MLNYITRPARTSASGKPPVIIVMHGFGADEHDLLNIADKLDPRYLAISLQAPISLSWGGFAWYHLQQTPRGILADDVSRHESEELVTGSIEGIIQKEGGDANNVILMGFSQGAAMSYALLAGHDLEKYGIKVKAVIALSGYLPRDILAPLEEKTLDGFPIFIAHGDQDQLIPHLALTEAEELLVKQGAKVSAKIYHIGHEVSEEVITDLVEWMKRL